MAMSILTKSEKFRYLFDDTSFKNFYRSEEQFNDIRSSYVEAEKYYSNIRKSMQSK